MIRQELDRQGATAQLPIEIQHASGADAVEDVRRLWQAGDRDAAGERVPIEIGLHTDNWRTLSGSFEMAAEAAVRHGIEHIEFAVIHGQNFLQAMGYDPETAKPLPETLDMIRAGDHKKGDVLGIARVAGIMAAKKTADLVPLCHPLALTHAAVDFELQPERHAVEITATVRLTGKTGVEMEALTGASVAALTIYDMCKSADKTMVIGDITLWEKTGGRSGTYRRLEE